MLDLQTFLAAVDYAEGGSLFPDSQLHGSDHWRAVAMQGLTLSREVGLGNDGYAIAALFGLFHDCRRINDGWDPEHGERARDAMLAYDPLRDALRPELRNKLALSLELHDKGQTTKDLLVGLGWDADRSVLTRVGITPSIEFFSCVKPDRLEDFVGLGEEASRNEISWKTIWKMGFESP